MSTDSLFVAGVEEHSGVPADRLTYGYGMTTMQVCLPAVNVMIRVPKSIEMLWTHYEGGPDLYGKLDTLLLPEGMDIQSRAPYLVTVTVNADYRRKYMLLSVAEAGAASFAAVQVAILAMQRHLAGRL